MLVVCALGLAMLVGCQGYFAGVVRDDSDHPILSARVTFLRRDPLVSPAAITDDAGNYRVEVDQEKYPARVTSDWHEDFSSYPTQYQALANRTVHVAFRLRAPQVTTVLLVRHAEKDMSWTGEDRLTPLTARGDSRAGELLHVVREAGVSAIYTTDCVRTESTVSYAADTLRLEREVYNTAPDLKGHVLPGNNGDVVLVAGHSNTVGDIASEFGVSSLPEVNDYDNLFVITRRADGSKVNLVNLQYGANSPPDGVPREEWSTMKTILLVCHSQTPGPTARAGDLLHTLRCVGIDSIYVDSRREIVQDLIDGPGNGIFSTYDPANLLGLAKRLSRSGPKNMVAVVAGTRHSIAEIMQLLNGKDASLPDTGPDDDDLFLATRYAPGEVKAKILHLQFGKRSE
jgi:phosphohistidine phosphatase SixA